jgi:glucokinase
MDIKAGLILDPPNLKPWKNVPVRAHVAGAFGKPTAYQNDANAAAYGEFWVGAASEAKSMVLFTLGTGVGGGIIIDHTIIEGEHSHGGELGHLRIAMPETGRQCGCGARGCLEAYASATNVVRRAREDMAHWRGPASKLRDYYTANDEHFTSKIIFRHAADGDELALKVVDDTAYYLALGACAVMATVDPEMIVFGGGMVAAGEWFRSKIDAYVKRFGLPFPTRSVKIAFASLGSDAGFIGAAGCARMLVRGRAPGTEK